MKSDVKTKVLTQAAHYHTGLHLFLALQFQKEARNSQDQPNLGTSLEQNETASHASELQL